MYNRFFYYIHCLSHSWFESPYYLNKHIFCPCNYLLNWHFIFASAFGVSNNTTKRKQRYFISNFQTYSFHVEFDIVTMQYPLYDSNIESSFDVLMYAILLFSNFFKSTSGFWFSRSVFSLLSDVVLFKKFFI